MAIRDTWRGVVTFTFKVDGNDIPVHVNAKLYNRVSPRKGGGFSLISPDKNPVAQKYVETEGFGTPEKPEPWMGSIGQCERAFNGTHIPTDVIAAIQNSERTRSITPESFVPMKSIDLALSKGAYYMTPDDESVDSAKVIWNGLLVNDLAYITRIVMRAGSADTIIAIYADEGGLKAVGLPFEGEVNQEPEIDWQVNDKAALGFLKQIQKGYGKVKDFDPAGHPSMHHDRRAAILEEYLADGSVPEIAPEPAPAASTPDLMALLEASIAEVSEGRTEPEETREGVPA